MGPSVPHTSATLREEVGEQEQDASFSNMLCKCKKSFRFPLNSIWPEEPRIARTKSYK